MSDHRLSDIWLLEELGLLLRQRLPARLTRLVDPSDRVKPDDRYGSLGAMPGQVDLAHLPALVAGQRLHAADDLLFGGRRNYGDGARRLGARRVLGRAPRASELAAVVRRVRQDPDARVAAEADHLALLLAVAQVVEVLHADEPGPSVLLGRELHPRELRRPHRARADVAHLARLHQVVQCLHGLLDRGGRVEAVDLEQIDVTGTEAREGRFYGVEDGSAREACVCREP